MRPSRNLPSSKFRLVAVATFAALAISPTVLGLNSGDADSAAPATSTPTTTTTPTTAVDAATDGVTTMTPSAADDAPTTTTPNNIVSSDTAVADEVTVGIGVDVLAVDAPPAPVSGQPIVVGDTDELSCPVEAPDDAESAATEVPASTTLASEDAENSSVEPLADIAGTTTTAPTTSLPATAPAADTAANDMTVSSFDSGAPGWVPLSGSWSVVGGEYVQGDATGYDFITQYPGDLPAEYALSVRLRATDGALGGGVMIAQPVPGSRRGATLIDFTDGGRFLRWGRYDADSGQYQYVGGVAMGDAFDTAASHRLTVEVRSGRTLVVVDGAAVGDFGPVGAGRIGLATSLSAVAFDDLEIVTL